MKKFLYFLSVIFTIIITGLSSKGQSGNLLPHLGSSLTVSLDKEGVSLNPSLYGIFFEQINMSDDGGVYAELIRNRSFEDIRPPEGCRIEGDWATTPGNFRMNIHVKDSIPSWQLIGDEKGRSSMHLDTLLPLNKAQQYSLRWEIKSNGNGVKLTNSGFYGISVKKEEVYKFSFYGHSHTPLTEKLLVSLEDESGKKFGSVEVAGIGKGWKKFTADIKANESNNHLKLVITASRANTIWLDMVSLFPSKTWNNRENGLRVDLMQLLKEMNPKFLRFPGGCVVEGVTFENMVLWKNTIGDVAARPGHMNIWEYRSSDGLGYHEFLQMCEDLACSPLYVVNIGMTCQARNSYSKPLDELQPMIQDVLDALEYANGSATSTWGALRAKAGHPAPFNLKYLEIGNENWGPEYNPRYLRFYDAVKANYPDIQLIRSAHPTADRNMFDFPDNKGDILDLHYYRSPDWLFKNNNIFDDYPRIGKKIYVGEYACNEKVGTGNLFAALGDATFLTAFERNGDIIELASYAPLFENQNKETYKWPVNLIHYDNNRVFALPTYYAQKMFMHDLGDVTLNSTLRSDSVSVASDMKILGGAIGFDTYSTASEFDDVLVVSGKDTLMKESFSSEKTKFPLTVASGSWKIEGGTLHQTDASLFAHANMGDTSWVNYTASFRARKIKGSEGFFLTFYQKDQQNYLKWNIGGWNNTQHAVELHYKGGNMLLDPQKGEIKENEWYQVKVEVSPNRIRCYLNNQLIHDIQIAEKTTYRRLYSVVTKDKKTNTVILKIVNPFDEETTLDINLDGTEKIYPSGEVITLTSGSADDTNTLDNPFKVVPVTSILEGINKHFTYRFKAHSLTFIKVKVGDK